MKSVAGIKYINQKNSEFKLLSERVKGNIPDSEMKAFYASVDYFQASELDSGFMNHINNFFEDFLHNYAKYS